jgi:hypothetical protein
MEWLHAKRFSHLAFPKLLVRKYSLRMICGEEYDKVIY